MTRRLAATILIAAVALGGCAMRGSPSASPAFTPQAECERNGGWWHTDMNFCEYQSPGGPIR
jgi:hypothetical protein